MLSVVSILVPILFSLTQGQTALANGPIVDLGYSSYQGAIASNMSVFLGLKYAAAPSGPLRWRSPEDPPTIPGVQDATVLPQACPATLSGGASATNPYNGSSDSFHSDAGRERGRRDSDMTMATVDLEDCLSLSVYTPVDTNNVTELLPVVFWIHGGGYLGGNSSQYTGFDLVHEAGYGVVAVVIQYRLALFGFLAGQAVKDDGALNAGLLDQNFALKWVQKHISKFGGDPSRVTIWGESAGAGSVLQHVVARPSEEEQLFRGAITSSTYFPPQYYYNSVIPEQIYSAVINGAQCSSSNDTLACLRETDLATLQNVSEAVSSAGFYGTFVFVPVVDGTFIIERPTETLRKGRNINGKMLLSALNTNEGTIFVNPGIAETVVVSEYVRQLFPTLSPKNVAAAEAIYTSWGSAYDQVVAIMNETIFICPTYYLLDAFNGSSYKAQYAIPPANHGDDGPVYFPSITFASPIYTNPDFLKAYSEFFLAFVRTLDPNDTFEPTLTPFWDRYTYGTLSRETEMVFNRTEAGEPSIGPVTTPQDLLARCAFWKSVGEEIGQ